MEQELPRSTIIAASAVRMEDGKVVETKGLKKRQIQRLNYGAVIKYRSEAGEAEHPDRGARRAARMRQSALKRYTQLNVLGYGCRCRPLNATRLLPPAQDVRAGGRPAAATRTGKESRTLTSRAR